MLVRDALRLRLIEGLNDTLEQRIELLEARQVSSDLSYTNLLKIEQEKYLNQKEITSDFVRLSDSWRDQSDYYLKRSKKFRRQRNGLAAGLVGIVLLTILK